jgi:hypothetical protein
MPDAFKRRSVFLFALWSVVALPVPAHAEGLGIAGHVGTLGLGADVAWSVQPSVGLRASLNYFPFDLNFSEDNVDYRLELPYPKWGCSLISIQLVSFA